MKQTRRKLSELKPGQTGVILGIEGREGPRRRLLALGFTRRTPVTVVRTAPLGDPIEMSLRGYRISIRRMEAATIAVATEEEG